MGPSSVTALGPGRLEILSIFGATLAIYLLIAIRLLPYVEPPTGDQPHYLLQTISLVDDGDLDLRNNYNESESYSQFSAPGRRRAGFVGIPVRHELDPSGHIVVRSTDSGEAWYPKHGTGLPILLVPGWLAGRALTPWLAGLTSHGNGAWPGTVVEMAIIGAVLAVQVWLLAWEVGGRRGIAYAVWAAISFSAPQVLTSLTVFPEAPAALALIYAFRHLIVHPIRVQSWRLVPIGLALAVLPWLNPRFTVVAGSLSLMALVALWRLGPPGRVVSTVFLIGPLALSGWALRSHQLASFGSTAAVAEQYEGFFVPTFADGRLGADWLGFLLGTLGLLLDRQYGLLVYAPVCVLAVVGLVALWQRPGGRWLVIGLGVVMVPYAALMSDFRVWWGGWSIPVRYLAVLTPLLAAPLAASLAALGGRRLYRVQVAILAVAGVLLLSLLLFALGDPTIEQAIFGNPSRNPALLRWLALRVGLDLSALLPGIAAWFGDRRAPIPWPQIAGCLAILFAMALPWLYVLRANRTTRDPELTRSGGARPAARLSGAVSVPAEAPDRV